MNTTINGFELLQAIGGNPDVFLESSDEIRKISTTILKKHLKLPSLKIERFRLIGSAVSVDVLLLILEELSENELRAITKKIDPNFQDLALASNELLRRHLRALAFSEIQPSLKEQKAPGRSKSSSTKAKTSPTSKEKNSAHWAESMAEKPKRFRK
jgi:hypothetical protein